MNEIDLDLSDEDFSLHKIRNTSPVENQKGIVHDINGSPIHVALDALNKVEIPSPNDSFPNGREIKNPGLKTVLCISDNIAYKSQEISIYTKEANDYQNSSAILRDLKRQLSQLLPDTKEITEKMAEQFELLKAKGISLWPHSDRKLSEGQIDELKKTCGDEIIDLRDKVHVLLTLKINHLVNAIGTLAELGKGIVNSLKRFYETISSNCRGR